MCRSVLHEECASPNRSTVVAQARNRKRCHGSDAAPLSQPGRSARLAPEHPQLTGLRDRPILMCRFDHSKCEIRQRVEGTMTSLGVPHRQRALVRLLLLASVVLGGMPSLTAAAAPSGRAAMAWHVTISPAW